MVLGVEDPSGSAGIGWRKGHSVVRRRPALHPHPSVGDLAVLDVPSGPNHLQPPEALFFDGCLGNSDPDCSLDAGVSGRDQLDDRVGVFARGGLLVTAEGVSPRTWRPSTQQSVQHTGCFHELVCGLEFVDGALFAALSAAYPERRGLGTRLRQLASL